MRIDKFLWCVRLFKTRGLATEACRREHVKWNDHPAKASRTVVPGDRIAVRVPPIWKLFGVKVLPASRTGAKLVPTFLEEMTSLDDLEKLERTRKAKAAHRDPGSGRPTKRERRDIDHFHLE